MRETVHIAEREQLIPIARLRVRISAEAPSQSRSDKLDLITRAMFPDGEALF